MKKRASSKPDLQAKANTPFFGKKEAGGGFLGPGHSGDGYSRVKSGRGFFSGTPAAGSGPVSRLQAKLEVGPPNDVHEKEADAVADEVVQRMAVPVKDRSAGKGAGHDTDLMAGAAIAGTAPKIQEKCAHCEQEEKKEMEEDRGAPKEKLQKKPIFESNAEPPDDETIRRKCPACTEDEKVSKKGEDGSSPTTSPAIENSLGASKGGGSPLPEATRGQMESSFGRDFSQVRIHTDSSAANMSKDLHAHAFTHGNDIYFNSGKYDPSGRGGQHLLAHELTHVVQQTGRIQKDDAPANDNDKVAQTVYDALHGWTSSKDSANILNNLKDKEKSATDAIVAGVASKGSMSVSGVYDWMQSDMVTSDWKALLDHFIIIQAYLIERAIADAVYGLIGVVYTTEGESHDVCEYLTKVSGELLNKVLTQLEGKKGATPEETSEWLFGWVTPLDAHRLSLYFFSSASTQAVSYATHWVASTIRKNLSWYTSIDDSRAIVRKFTDIPDAMRTYVLYELDKMSQAKWNKPASQELMESMQQEDYEQLRKLMPSLPVYNIERNFLEWAWDKVTIGFDYVEGWIEYGVCGIFGSLWGLVVMVKDILASIIDIGIAIKDIIGMVIYFCSGGKFGRESKERVWGFFSGLSQFFDAPMTNVKLMWGEMVQEATLMEGPFRECQQAIYWMTKLTNLVVNIILIFAMGYGAVKAVIEGIEGLVALIRAGELVNALKALPGKLFTTIKNLPSTAGKAIASTVSKVVELFKNPMKVITTVRDTITAVRLAAQNEGYFGFLRRQAGKALDNEGEFWKKRKDFWLKKSDVAEGKLAGPENKLTQAANVAVDSPDKAKALIAEADADAKAPEKEANDLMDDVKGDKQLQDDPAAPSTKSFEDQLPDNWKTGKPERPPMLGFCIDKLRAAKFSDDITLQIIKNAAANTDVRPADFFADLNIFAGNGQEKIGADAYNNVVNGLGNNGRFRAARFLMRRSALNQDISDLARVFTLDDVGALQARFATMPDSELARQLNFIAAGIDGSREDILKLLDEAGQGQAALDNLAGAVDRLGEGKFTPDKVRESLQFKQKLAKAITGDADELAKAIWGDAFAGRDEKGRIKVSEALTKKKAGDQAVAYINARRAQVASQILGGDGGTSIDMVEWGKIENALRNTDLPVSIQNNMIGEVWSFTKVRQYENLGFTVIREVSIRVLDDAGKDTGLFAKVDAVLRKGDEVHFREFKTGNATTSGNQDVVYDLLGKGEKKKLQPFGDRAAEAFGGPGMPEFKTEAVKIERSPQ